MRASTRSGTCSGVPHPPFHVKHAGNSRQVPGRSARRYPPSARRLVPGSGYAKAHDHVLADPPARIGDRRHASRPDSFGQRRNPAQGPRGQPGTAHLVESATRCRRLARAHPREVCRKGADVSTGRDRAADHARRAPARSSASASTAPASMSDRQQRAAPRDRSSGTVSTPVAECRHWSGCQAARGGGTRRPGRPTHGRNSPRRAPVRGAVCLSTIRVDTATGRGIHEVPRAARLRVRVPTRHTDAAAWPCATAINRL